MRTSALAIALLALGAGACGEQTAGVIDLGYVGGGKQDFTRLVDFPLTVPPASDSSPGKVELEVTASSDFRVLIEETTSTGALALEVDAEPAAGPAATVDHTVEVSAQAAFRLAVLNHGTETAQAKLSLLPPASDGAARIPRLDDPVVSENEFARYHDTPPFVRDADINWDHPLIKSAMRALGPGWRSMISYWMDRRSAYKLEYESGRTPEAGAEPGTIEARELSTDDRDILEAAEEVLYGWNGSSATVDRIASAAGVSVQEIADRFPPGDLAAVKEAVAEWGRRRRNAKVRNFIRVLLGELRDHPAMIRRKLEVITDHHTYAGPDEVSAFDTSRDLFDQITEPAYERMINVMGALHRYRQRRLREDGCVPPEQRPAPEGYNYNFGDSYHSSNREQLSVAPWSHCEMKFMFSRYMVDGAPQLSSYGSSADAEQYEIAYAAYRGVTYDPNLCYDDEARLDLGPGSQCTEQDVALMYNFRGHVNYKPLWLESNGFIHNSRRGNTLRREQDDYAYYQRPFASRYLKARQLLGMFLLYPEQDNDQLRRASESGGGPILYVTDQDADGDNIADYRLFAEDGCGDVGVGSYDPSKNCNMVPWDTAFSTPSTTGHLSSWQPERFWDPDMGFLGAVSTFEERMARFNQALDRHTNWGPTGYYMIGAAESGAAADDIRFLPTYSPIVACSYDISASSGFARRDFDTTHPFESGKTKWMYIMRFKTADYYDELDMKAGKPFDLDRSYFNETSLSNDYYTERALDRFGWVPAGDVYANVYFVYGARGEQPPELEDIPTP